VTGQDAVQVTSAATTDRAHWLRAHLALLAGVTCIGFSGIFTRSAGAPGIVMAVWRVAIATLVLFIPFWRQDPRRRRMRRSLLGLAIFGGVLFSTDLGIWQASLDYTTAANATFLGNTAPLWVGLLTLVVLRERLPRRFWPSAVLAVGGAALMIFSSQGDVSVQQGDLMALSAGLFWAGYQIVTARVRVRMSNLSYVWIMSATCTVLLLPIIPLSGFSFTGYSSRTMLLIVMAGLVSQVGGYLGINYSLGYLSAARVTILIMLQPVIAAVGAYLLLGEAFDGWRLVGGGLIMVGVYLVTRPERASSTA